MNGLSKITIRYICHNEILQVLPQDVDHSIVFTLYTQHVHLSDSTKIHTCIQENLRFWPFFKDAIGALDGSHIHAAPGRLEHGTYRNHKGFTSQNCLFACDFDLFFTYVLTGWEGLATNAHVYEDACTKGLKCS